MTKDCFVIGRNSDFDWILVAFLYHKLDANKNQYTLTMRGNKNRFSKFGQNDRTEKPQYKETIYSQESWKTNYKNFCKWLSPTVLTVYAVVGTSSA